LLTALDAAMRVVRRAGFCGARTSPDQRRALLCAPVFHTRRAGEIGAAVRTTPRRGDLAGEAGWMLGPQLACEWVSTTTAIEA